MNKIICFALLTLSLFGCADDESAPAVSGPKPVSVTSHIENGLSQTKTFAYDAKGRLATLTKSGEVITFSYDENNRLRRIESDAKNYYLNYDQDGKLREFINATENDIVEFTHQGNNNYLAAGIFIAFHENGDFRKLDNYDFGYSDGKGPFANVKHLNMFGLALADERALWYGAIKRRQSLAIDGISMAYECDDDPLEVPISERIDETTYSYQYE